MAEQSSGSARERKWSSGLGAVVRWLHTYVSMLGFLALLFFAVTGFTLNHADWFHAGGGEICQMQGSIDPGLLRPEAATDENFNEEAPAVAIDYTEENLTEEAPPPPVEELAAPAVPIGYANETLTEEAPPPPVDDFGAPGPPVADTDEVDKLAIVETLRSRHALKGAVSNFSADGFQCIVSFNGPGYSADAFIDRATGQYNLTEARQGLLAVLNDLHKGRVTGPAWSWVIDVSAVVMTIASITGLALLLVYKRRRRTGLLAAVLGSVAVILIYVLYVP